MNRSKTKTRSHAGNRLRAILTHVGMVCSATFFAAAVASAADSRARPIAFTPDLNGWRVEQSPGGTVRDESGALVIEDEAGCTVWWKEKLTAPLDITYDVTVVAKGGPHDRVSDVNCFWMASEPATNAEPAPRSGKFSEYDSLQTYYMGMGGNDNTTTRFRRYAGGGARPLLEEHDLRAPKFLLEANHTYHIRLVAREGVAEFWRDGEKILTFADPTPLTAGWFGFRTVKSHLEIRNLVIITAPSSGR